MKAMHEQASRRKWIILSAVMLLAGLVVWVGFHTHAPDLSHTPPFDSFILKHKVSNLFMRWRASAWDRPARSGQGNTTGSAPVYLVIDVNKKALWIERGGRVAEVEKVTLAETMEWQVMRITPSGSIPLKSPVYLKMRQESDQAERIIFYGIPLPGFRSNKAERYATFDLNGTGNGFSNQKVDPLQWVRFFDNIPSKSNKGMSILVTSEELKSDRLALAQAGTLPQDSAEAALFGEDARRWARMEDRILDEIMKRLPCPPEGVSLTVYSPIPSFTAAYANFGLSPRPSPLQFLGLNRMGKFPWEAEFLIKYFKDGVWGVCGDKEFSTTRFLVSEDPKLDLKPYQPLLSEMALRLNPIHKPDPKFMAHFSNGATVELIGLCECPITSQTQWWKPDGTPLTEKPYYDYESRSHNAGKDMRWVAYAMHVKHPSSSGSTYIRSRMSPSRGSSSFLATDEYGRGQVGRAIPEGNAGQFLITQKTADLAYGLGASRDTLENITFKNIALYPGEKTDFKIIAAPADAGHGDAQKQNGRP